MTRATDDGARREELPLREKERAVVAALAVDHPRPVARDLLIERIWPHGPPATARKALHNHVARLRRTGGDDLVETTTDGYRLGADVELDLEVSPGDDGVPFADLDDDAPGVTTARRAAVRARTAHRVAGRVDGDPSAAIDELERTVDDDPFAEEAWLALGRAYVAAGRRREASQVFGRARREFAAAGLAIGTRLEDAERLLLSGAPIERHPLAADRGGGLAPSQEDRSRLVVDTITREPAMVVLYGPAGIGKTTTLDDIARRAATTRRVVVTSCEAEPVRPLEPIAVIVDDLLSRAPHVVDALGDAAPLSLLSDAVATAIGHEPNVIDPERRRLEAAVVDLLTVRELQPLAVVIDDLHWATAATRHILATAVERAVTLGVDFAVVAGWRGTRPTTLLSDEHTTYVPVLGLDADEIGSLAGLDPPAAGRLHDATGGNPLFVRELLEAGHGDPLNDEIPSTVAALLAARVGRLGPAGLEAAAAAAVLGRRQLVADIESMAPGASVTECTDAGILRRVGADATEFDHDLLRRAVLDSLGTVRRVELHDAAARAIELSPRAADRATELAHHAVEAGTLDPLGAAHHAQIAAGIHQRHGNHLEAADLLRRTATVLADAGRWPARRVELLIDEGAARLRAGDPEARTVFDTALALASQLDDPSLYGRATIELCRLGPTTESGVNDIAAVAAIDRALEIVTEPGIRARVAAAATMVHSMGGEISRCRELLETALAEAAADGRPEVLGDVLPFAYMTLSEPGDLDRRMDIAGRLEEVGVALRRPDIEWEAHQIGFSNALQLGLPRLRDDLVRLETLAAQIRERTRDWEMHYLRATVAQLDDDLDESERIITESLAFADTLAPSRVVAVYGVHLLALRIAQGRVGELVDDLTTLATEQPGVGGWQAALALAAAEAGDETVARRAFHTASADDFALLDRDFSFTGSLFCLGMAAAALGDPELACVALRGIEPLAPRWSWVGTTTLGPMAEPVARCLVVTGASPAPVRDPAIDVARRLGAPRYAERLASI